MPLPCHHTEDHNHPLPILCCLTNSHSHPYAYTIPPYKKWQSSICLYSSTHIKHHNHPHTSNQNCCYGNEIALVSFNHSCYWITRLFVGLCGWLSQHSAAASNDLASSDAGNNAQVTVQYCVLHPGEHFRYCTWPCETVASLALNAFVLMNSLQLVLMFHYMVN